MYLTENRLSRNEMWCAVDNHNYICATYVQKDFRTSNLMKRLLRKYHFFTKLPQTSHIHKNRRPNCDVLIGKRYCFYPINCMACRDMYTESIFSPFLAVVSLNQC